MAFQDLYHGAAGDKILSVLQEGMMRPVDGRIYFGRFESEYPNLFQYGADILRGASFVIKVRVDLPENARLLPVINPGAPRDAWMIDPAQMRSAGIVCEAERRFGADEN